LIQRKGIRTAWSWDLQSTHTIYDGTQDPDHLPGGRTFPIGEEVIVEVGDGRPAGVMTWNLQDGIRPLIRWYGDSNQAAGNFGTDGKDMVWTYIAGANLGGAKYETMSVMTAPFTTSADEATATAHRLRNDVKGFEGDGCDRSVLVNAPRRLDGRLLAANRVPIGRLLRCLQPRAGATHPVVSAGRPFAAVMSGRVTRMRRALKQLWKASCAALIGIHRLAVPIVRVAGPSIRTTTRWP
jgi:hypothetical protein